MVFGNIEQEGEIYPGIFNTSLLVKSAAWHKVGEQRLKWKVGEFVEK